MEPLCGEIDQLHFEGRFKEAKELISPHKDNEDTEIQWRYARAIFKVAEVYGKKGPEKEKVIAEGLVILEKNLKKKPDCPMSHAWAAVLYGSKDTHENFKQKIAEAFVIKEHVTKCLELRPDCELAYHIWGSWCHQVASVSWYERKIASSLFATPPVSTHEEALTHLKKAEKLNPNIFNHNSLLIAKISYQLGKKQDAAIYLAKCIEAAKTRKQDLEQTENAEEAKTFAAKNKIKL